VPTGTAQEELVKLARAEPGVAQHLDGKRIVKIVYVPNKLLNFVVS
jgi:leucyl-tRNA synthetase